LHYFWDIAHGNPVLITEFPRPESFDHFQSFKLNPAALVDEKFEKDYVALTQNPYFRDDPRWDDVDEAIQSAFSAGTGLKFLRPYQLRALQGSRERFG